MLFMILIAVVLIGFLTAAIMKSNNAENANIDKEELAIRAAEAQRSASEYERAVLFILNGKYSEVDVRFAHPAAHADYGDMSDGPARQVFHPSGGAATYHKPPDEINDGSNWEFYGGTAIPGVGSAKADLVAVLPHVTKQFCERINDVNGQPMSPIPTDTGSTAASAGVAGDCVNQGAGGRFNDSEQFYKPPNTMTEASFSIDSSTTQARTANQACVECDDGTYNFYHVLLAR